MAAQPVQLQITATAGKQARKKNNTTMQLQGGQLSWAQSWDHLGTVIPLPWQLMHKM